MRLITQTMPPGILTRFGTFLTVIIVSLKRKDIDWEAVGRKYRAEINPETNYIELLTSVPRMLDELKDGHVNLSSSFNTSYYRRWWSDYPQDFNFRTLQQYYLGFDYQTTSGIIYKKLSDKVGYMYYPSFSSGIS